MCLKCFNGVLKGWFLTNTCIFGSLEWHSLQSRIEVVEAHHCNLLYCNEGWNKIHKWGDTHQKNFGSHYLTGTSWNPAMSILEAQPLVGWNCPGKCHLAPRHLTKTRDELHSQVMSYDMTKTLASLWGCYCYRPLSCRYKTSKELKSPKPRHFTRTLLVLTLCYALLRCVRLLKSNWSEREQSFVGFVGLADPSRSGSPSGSVNENNKNIHRYCYCKGTIGCWYMECVTDHCLRTRLLAVQGVSVLAL